MSQITTTSDEPTRNVDADNPPPKTPRTPASEALDQEAAQQEAKCVQQWLEDITLSRAFDEEIRKLYAIDRSYARGETSALVQHSLIQAYVDILVAFIAARDPDFDCLPADSVGEAGKDQVELYGKTMEIVVPYLLKSAKIKRVAARQVRSALTVGIGWLKAVWYEQWQTDPQVKKQVNDAQANLAQVQAQQALIDSGEAEDLELEVTKLNQLIEGLQQRVETMAAHGMALAMINPEDMVSSIENECVIDVDMNSWMGHRFFVSAEQARADYPRLTTEQLGAATKYSPRQPGKRADSKQPGAVRDFSADDADTYIKGSNQGKKIFLCGYEIWDAATGQFFTVLEGVAEAYAELPAPPPVPTERFYPFFALSFTEVDGERHPQSLIQRSYKMQDEIDRCLNSLVEHRRAVKPFLVFDKAALTPATAKALTNNKIAERVAVAMIGPQKDRDLRKVLSPVQYNAIDMALYDIAPYVRCMETTWGIQEALTGTVQVAKTATEAEIQQAGTQAKSGAKRDILETMLSELGRYTAECASNKLTREDVVTIAGPGSFWIQLENVDMLRSMLQVDVRAGSSGKPDTAARREAWGVMVSQIKELVEIIGTLRQSTPVEVADCLERLLLETGERFGERIDMKQFIPQPPEQVMVDPATGQPLTGDQVDQARTAAQGQAGAANQAAAESAAEPPADGQAATAPVQTPAAITGAP